MAMSTEIKPWYKSKTIRTNILAAVLVAVEAKFQVFKPMLGEHTYELALFTLTMVNVALRVITTQPVR